MLLFLAKRLGYRWTCCFGFGFLIAESSSIGSNADFLFCAHGGLAGA
jgi:hypothetical protein